MEPGPITLDGLRRLPAPEAAALMGLAGLGLPATNAHLAQALLRVRAHPEAEAWAANPRRVQTVLERLRERGLAAERRGYWHCREACLESAARLAQARGLLGPLFRGVAPGAGTIPDGAMRSRAELRIALVEGRPGSWLPLRERFREAFAEALAGRDPLALVCGGPFEPAWFEALGPEARALGAQALLTDHVLQGRRDLGWMAWMEARAAVPGPGPLAPALIAFLVLQGRLDAARAWMGAQPEAARRHAGWPALEGLAALAAGEPAEAAARYQEALDRSSGPLPPLHAPFHILALLGSRRAQAPALARRQAEAAARTGPLGALLLRLCTVLDGAPGPVLGTPPPAGLGPLAQALAACAAHLGGEPVPPAFLTAARQACEGLPLAWPATDLEELERRQGDAPPRPRPLLDLAPAEAPWERALRAIARLGDPLDFPTGRPQAGAGRPK